MRNALYVTPSRVTSTRDKSGNKRSALQAAITKINLADNSYRGQVSEQTMKKIRLAVQWMVTLARRKQTTDRFTKKLHTYRCGLVTVALPTGCEDVDPVFFRSVLLTSLIDAMAYNFRLKHYIWKMERQGNGTLHCHITVDEWIPYQWLNEYWCKLLDKHGLLSAYSERFSSMTCREYVRYRASLDLANAKSRHSSHLSYVRSCVKAYRRGVQNEWKRPNCTDVHSVKHIRNLAGYMSKYLAKDPKMGADFKGRFWACSHSLSKLRSIKVNYDDHHQHRIALELQKVSTETVDLWTYSKVTQEPINYASIAYLNLKRHELMQSVLLGPVFNVVRRLYHNTQSFEPPSFHLDGDFSMILNPVNFT